MLRRQGLLVLFIAAVLGVCPDVATGQTLYGLTAPPGQQLITINTATGVGTLVGTVGIPVTINSLAFRGAKLYTFDFQAGMRELNPATAAVLATIDIGLISPSWNTGGLAFRSDGIGFLGDGPNSLPNTSLYSFDVTVPSNTQITPNFTLLNSSGLAFSPADVLYGYDVNTFKLYTVNQATGVTTVVGNTGMANPGTSALAFDSSGNLFLALNTAGPASDLYKVDKVTAVATKIGPIGFNFVQGLAFSGGGPPPPPPPPPPPSPSPTPTNPGEGSFGGVQDPPPASEGSFSFGFGAQRAAKTSRPTLAGPFLATAGAGRTPAPSGLVARPPAGTSLQVYNTAGIMTAKPDAPQASSGAAGALGWTVLVSLGMVVAVGLGKGSAALWNMFSPTASV